MANMTYFKIECGVKPEFYNKLQKLSMVIDDASNPNDVIKNIFPDIDVAERLYIILSHLTFKLNNVIAVDFTEYGIKNYCGCIEQFISIITPNLIDDNVVYGSCSYDGDDRSVSRIYKGEIVSDRTIGQKKIDLKIKLTDKFREKLDILVFDRPPFVYHHYNDTFPQILSDIEDDDKYYSILKTIYIDDDGCIVLDFHYFEDEAQDVLDLLVYIISNNI